MKWYWYNQNNSGGNFVVNNKVCHNVFIQANNMEEADDKAEEIGIYFYGVSNGIDCECCGDRWNTPEEQQRPNICGTPVSKFRESSGKFGKPYAYLYYADGKVKRHLHKEVK